MLSICTVDTPATIYTTADCHEPTANDDLISSTMPDSSANSDQTTDDVDLDAVDDTNFYLAEYIVSLTFCY